MKVFDYSRNEKQCIKVLSSLSSGCFRACSFPDPGTDTTKVKNVQESKICIALNDRKMINSMLSRLSSQYFGACSFPDPVTEAIKVKNIQESKRSHIFKVHRDLFLLNLKHNFLCDLSVAEVFFS